MLMQACFLVVRNSTFNEGHWVFAREYFVTSQYMPYLLAKEPVPYQLIKRNKLIKQTVSTLNLSVPLCQGLSLFAADMTFGTPAWQKWTTFNVLANDTNYLLQTVTIIFLGIAITRIRKVVN